MVALDGSIFNYIVPVGSGIDIKELQNCGIIWNASMDCSCLLSSSDGCDCSFSATFFSGSRVSNYETWIVSPIDTQPASPILYNSPGVFKMVLTWIPERDLVPNVLLPACLSFGSHLDTTLHRNCLRQHSAPLPFLSFSSLVDGTISIKLLQGLVGFKTPIHCCYTTYQACWD